MYSIKVDEIRFIRDTKLDLHIDMKDFHVGDSCITGSLIHLFKDDSEINTKMDLTELLPKRFMQFICLILVVHLRMHIALNILLHLFMIWIIS